MRTCSQHVPAMTLCFSLKKAFLVEDVSLHDFRDYATA